MAEGDIAPRPGGGGFKGFLGGQTAGLPNWAWLLVIAAGIGLAYVVPKFVNKGTGESTKGTGDTKGLGLAIDPTTGLPYAVEGLVPSGAMAGNGTVSGGGSALPDISGETSGNWEHRRWQDESSDSSSVSSSNGTTGTSIANTSSALMHATVRSKNSRPEIRGTEDKSTGLPIRKTPGGAVKKDVAYKSSIYITGSPVSGPYNLPGNKGSNLWYPVEGGGYFSQYDIGNFASNSPGVRGWP